MKKTKKKSYKEINNYRGEHCSSVLRRNCLSEEYKFRKFSGITLICLVITIVVLIILSSVAIYLGLSGNGIFIRAKQAKEVTNKQEATDIINLKITTAQINKYAEKQEMLTLKELSEVLKKDNEIQYVTKTSKVAVAEYDVSSENPSSIYTKLNNYPYEFEINSSLQLASINGVKLGKNETPSNTPQNSQNTMSGEEHFIGQYYFNGKPIYEKTLYIESLPNKSTCEYNHKINNIDEIWVAVNNSFINLNEQYGEYQTTTIPWKHTTNSSICLYATKEVLEIVCAESNRSNWSTYITLNYTKTTDIGNGNTISPTPAN